MFVSMTVGAMLSHIVAAFVAGAAIAGSIVWAISKGNKENCKVMA